MTTLEKIKPYCSKLFCGMKLRASNAIFSISERKKLRKYARKMPPLTSAQKKIVKDFWKPYCKVSMDWFRYFTYITGKFDPRYIPNDLPHRKIDQYFNQWNMYGLTDKNNFSLIFPGIKQPKTIVRKIGDLLFDGEYHLINLEKAEALLKMQPEVIVKPTIGFWGGNGVEFYNTSSEMDKIKKILLDKNKKRVIIQDLVKQHFELAKMHPQSLNTVRIYSLLMDDGVHILSSSLRMGANNSRIDNVSANSGIIAGVKEDGSLKETAYFDLYSGIKTDRHPQGMLLSEIKVPSYDKMIETVKRAAQYAGNFRLVGWDLSVDEGGDVVLIEANMLLGEIGPIQCLHGPFFGELTEKVLETVFRGGKK